MEGEPDADSPSPPESSVVTMEESPTNEQPEEMKKSTQGDPYAKPDGPVLKIDIEEKESFASKLSYLLILIGNAVGFGNIWRFPYLLQQNGGIIFLIPYVCMLTFLGIPMFFLELAIGQRIHKSCLKSWNDISHYLGGVGLTCGLICLVIGFYYTTLISWCVRYTVSVFGERLPWQDCNEAEVQCRDLSEHHLVNGTMNDPHLNQHHLAECRECHRIGASTHFWYNNVLGVTGSIEEPGEFNPKILVCLLISWFIIWAILIKGMRGTGKVVYFTAVFPYFVLVTFFIRGLLLPNMQYGYAVAFSPDWRKLYDVNVWFTAGTQIFFSLGLGFGLLVSFSALNPAKNNCYKDAIMVSLINCSTSLFAGMVIFPILGYKGSIDFEKCHTDTKNFELNYEEMEGLKNKSIARCVYNKATTNQWQIKADCTLMDGSVIPLPTCNRTDYISKSAQGTGLVFIVFTEAMNSFAAPQLFAFLFFLMLLSLGIGSGFTTVEGVVCTLHELNLGGRKIKKWKITTGVCAVLACLSTVFAFGWANYVLTFLDEFTANWTLLISAFFECIGVAWIYGLKQFSYDIQLMTGKPPNLFLLICWRFISPILMIVLLVLSFVNLADPKKGFKYTVWSHVEGKPKETGWPLPVIGIGFFMTFLVILPIPLCAILAKFKIYIIKPEQPAPFPEEELRQERNITEVDDIAPENKLERVLFWGSSNALYRRRSSTVSAMAFNMGLTGQGQGGQGQQSDSGDEQGQSGQGSPATTVDPSAAV